MGGFYEEILPYLTSGSVQIFPIITGLIILHHQNFGIWRRCTLHHVFTVFFLRKQIVSISVPRFLHFSNVLIVNFLDIHVTLPWHVQLLLHLRWTQANSPRRNVKIRCCGHGRRLTMIHRCEHISPL